MTTRILPIPGVSHLSTLEGSAAATSVSLDPGPMRAGVDLELAPRAASMTAMEIRTAD